MNVNEFDIDFDFEKEYGFDPPEEKKEAPAEVPADEDFDLRSILNSDYGAEQDPSEDFNFDEYLRDMPISDPVPPEETQEPELRFEEPVVPSEEPTISFDEPVLPDEDPVPAFTPEEELPRKTGGEPAPQRRERPQRRKPKSKLRQFKDEQLPMIIAGVAAVLILIFIFGSIGRAVSSHKSKTENNDKVSDAQQSAAEVEAKEAQKILDEAAALAAGYDYQGAIDKLNTFTGDTSKYTDFTLRSSEYAQALTQLVAHNDPDEVANLSFHVLIADPSRAFTDQSLGGKYNMNFVTVDEFQLILEQLYANNYVLVNMDDFVDEVVAADGTVTYASKTLYLPDGKKPIMITETMVNYYYYMVDGDSDGVADAKGAGFASRLVVDGDSKVKAEMVDSSGNTVVGDYDLVPILDKFIEENPGFSYQGAKATLAVSGDEGIFGYRIQKSVIDSKGQDYYDEQVAGATKVVEALRASGYEIACYTYSDTNYSSANATEIQADIDSWTKEIVPVLGTVDTIVYAKGSDIASAGAYSGSKYNVLAQAGFRYFIGSGNKATTDIYTDYIRQNRIMVTGTQMYYTNTMYSAYFDSKSVLNSLRGNIPQS
ncbi:MAG: hypothetical protein IJ375_00510 [Oscillospiraceae bacterium]|nr:hypothetical protein [Oscillospiraceae bacterium]